MYRELVEEGVLEQEVARHAGVGAQELRTAADLKASPLPPAPLQAADLLY